MLIHSEYGRYLIGCRKSFLSKVQMVYDFKDTCRKVYDLEAQDVQVARFNSTIKIVIQFFGILPTLLAILSAQNMSIRETA